MSGALDDLRNELSAMLAGLDVAQMQRRLAARPEAWNIQQIAEHLLRTYDTTLNLFEERLLKGRCTKASATLKQRWGQLLIARVGYFPHGHKAPEFTCPPVMLEWESGDQTLARVSARLQGLKTIFQEAENAWGQGRCVSHFALGPMSVENWALFHRSHGRHHVKQMMAIRRELGL
ncbi:MAG TPA: DinB family protein [Acidobacteriaceae bacterium]